MTAQQTAATPVPVPADVAAGYRAAGFWRDESLGDLLLEFAATDPGRIAVVDAAGAHSYGDLNARVDRVAGGLAGLGVAPGDRILVQLPNDVDFVVVLIAAMRIGAAPVLALPSHRRSDLEHLARLAGTRVLVLADAAGSTDLRPTARQLRTTTPVEQVVVRGDAAEFIALADLGGPAPTAPVDPASPAFYFLTGGTTGRSKLVPRAHREYSYQLRVTAEAMRFEPGDAYLAALPAAHNAALGCPGVLGALAVGGTAILARTPGPDEIFALIRRYRPKLTTVMPPLLPLWLDLAPLFDCDLHGLIVEVGGAMLDPAVAHRALVAGIRLSHWFGMAEGVLWCTRLDDPDEVVVGTQGRPLCPGDEYRVVTPDGRAAGPGEVGELHARGPMTLRSYLVDDDSNATSFDAGGYLCTGDLVRIDAGGNLQAVGRIKDVVNRGGEKVPAAELEAHLRAHPDVADAAVVPVPDRALGEKTCAVVVPDGPAPSLGEVRAFLRDRGLAEFKLPDRLEIRTELTRTNVGKIDKAALRAALGA